MDGPLVRRFAAASGAAERALGEAYERGSLSARGYDRVLRVARTIADLEDRGPVELDHLLQALALRQHDHDDRADAA